MMTTIAEQNMELRAKLRDDLCRIVQAGMTRAELARRLNRHPNSLVRYVAGMEMPNITWVEAKREQVNQLLAELGLN